MDQRDQKVIKKTAPRDRVGKKPTERNGISRAFT